MPFGCFGKRKKKEKQAASPDTGDDSAKKEAAADANGEQTEASEELLTAGRSSGLQSAVQPSEPSLRSASLARSDFLRKSDYANSADRWEALKRQYLTPKMSQSQYTGHLQVGGNRGGREAKSLPREFSPPSTVVSVVKFSQWFYDRQLREEEARREAHEREERTLSLIESFEPVADEATAAASTSAADDETVDAKQQEQEQRQNSSEQHQHQAAADDLQDFDTSDPRLNEAAAKIQAGFKGMHARKEVQEMRRHLEEEQHQTGENQHQTDENQDQTDENQHQTGENQHQTDENQHQTDENQHQTDENQHHSSSHEDHTEEEINEAAAKIQAGFKGYKTRKELGLLHHAEADTQEEATVVS